MLRIDIFSHFFPHALREAYLGIPLGAQGRRLDANAIRTFIQAQRTTDIDVLWDIDQRIKVLDRYGIDLQVLTLAFPTVMGLEPEAEIRLARMANDGLADIIRKYPNRFIGVATLPLSVPSEALKEFDRSVDQLGFKGFQITSNINGMLLDAPQLFPIYERAARRGLPMWIHPTTPVTLDFIGTKANSELLLGWPIDTTIALFKLMIAGVLERLPTLKVIVHHLGAGTIPYFMERLDAIEPGQDGVPITKPPSHYWKMMYHDTAAVGANAFMYGYGVWGEDHVVFGTDYPYGRNKGEQFVESRRQFLDKALIDESARRKIYEDNARKLLNLS